MRKAGILCAVSSLPGSTGIGDFGLSSYRFIDDLTKCGMKYWQILPLNPLGYGNSPYQPYSSFAMDELYLSLDLLLQDHLITDYKKFNQRRKSVSYDAVRRHKEKYLKEAFSRFKSCPDYEVFIQNSWVRPYALFLTLKKHNQNKCWLEWPLIQQQISRGSDYDLSELEEEINYEMFIQFKLYEQWMNVKKYANSKGIEIIGDLPIYVGIDSEDVWSHQESFLLDDDGHPTFIAGVPPDYFSKTGQRWGNPLYDWDYLKQHDFRFWKERLSYNTKLFDIIRIDHFRAFDTYWKIPSSCPTAIEGEWIEAPGYELFDSILKDIPDLHLIAEDLGDLREEVLILRDHYHFPGMKIVQFEFDPLRKDNNQIQNRVIYPGTHDNQTLRSWYASSKPSFKKQTQKFFNNDLPMTTNFIELTLSDQADMAILPMQDILNLSDRARMNRPGTIGSPNWEWKMADFKDFEKELPKIKELLKKHHRFEG